MPRTGKKCKPGCQCGRHKNPGTKKLCPMGCTCGHHDPYSVIQLGRKSCRACKRWRLLADFQPRTWWDSKKTRIKTVYGECRRCTNLRKAGVDLPRAKFKGYGRKSQEQERVEAQHRHEKRMREDAAYAKCHREYHRIYSEGKRRQMGMSPRSFRNRGDPTRAPRLDPAPLASYLQEINLPTKEISLATGVDDALLHRIVTGKQPLTMTTADQIFTGLGRPELLVVLYPDV